MGDQMRRKIAKMSSAHLSIRAAQLGTATVLVEEFS